VRDRIVELYKIEYRAAEQDILGTDAHRDLRQALSKPITDQIKTWCDEQKPLHVPKGPLGQAIGYALNEWEALTVFLDDPKISLDNNVSERALRILALGRHNFLFVGHDEAGQNLAILQTLVATCKLHDVNPYLVDVLIRVQTHPQARIDELLPMNWAATRAAL
jgi:transposase